MLKQDVTKLEMSFFTRTIFINEKEFMQKNSKLTRREQEILLQVGFHEDKALRRLIIELRRTFGIEQREVFGALDFANTQGLDVKFYLSSLREREKTIPIPLHSRPRDIALNA